MHISSIRFKTTLLYSGILSVILVSYNVALFIAVHSILLKDVDEQLRVKAGEIVNVLQAYEKIDTLAAHPLSILERALHEHGVLPARKFIIDDLWRSDFETLKLARDYIAIRDLQGRSVLQSGNVTPLLMEHFAHTDIASNMPASFQTFSYDDHQLRSIGIPFIYKKQLALTVHVATPLDDLYSFLHKLLLISSLCILAIIIMTSFLGSFFVRRILNPVVAVTKVANALSHRDLGTRILRKDADVEMSQLIGAFNSMIERLQRSFDHINEFNSYVAHELKTPLAIVKGELELIAEQLSRNEDKKIVGDCLEEIDRMIRITKDLLLLAKLDYKPKVFKFEKLDFKMFFDEIYEYSVALASEKQITAHLNNCSDKTCINGDKLHLRRLFLNIITNAIKYTPSGGSIFLYAEKKNQDLCVTVCDTGSGIADEDLENIFKKFFRVDKGEKTPEAGVGLGLSIALSIAKAHQGNISVHSQLHKGTVFTIMLPLAL